MQCNVLIIDHILIYEIINTYKQKREIGINKRKGYIQINGKILRMRKPLLVQIFSEQSHGGLSQYLFPKYS